MKGNDGIERNAFQQWIAELTTAAERWAKVPYDLVIPKDGLTPNVHRLASLGHNPVLGLVFGVKDILAGSCTFIDKSGAWRVIDHPNHEGTRDPVEALVKVVVHGFSDVFTAQGLPPPFMAPFQLVSAKSGITLKEGGDPVAVRDVVRYMYANGYDLRHFMATKISPAIAEGHSGRVPRGASLRGRPGARTPRTPGQTEAGTDAGPHPRTTGIRQHPEDSAVRPGTPWRSTSRNSRPLRSACSPW